MIKKNSTFIRILIPVTIVMLMQTVLIGIILVANGTFSSLEDSSIQNLRKNTENRGISLENLMVNRLSNLDRLENDITSVISDYLFYNEVTIDDINGDGFHEINLLHVLSDPLKNALRQTSSTGAFIYFIDSGDAGENENVCNGLYYRDLDPISTSADNSDLLFLRGFVDIARKDKIQLDSLWSETFYFSANIEGPWRGYYEPLFAAVNNPGLSPSDLSYWSAPHLINPNSPIDSNECITYTRPFFFEGRLVAMIGTEMQLEQLKTYFPAKDFDMSGKGGYMVLKYSARTARANGEINSEVYAVTGSYINRLLGSISTITLAPDGKEGSYTITSHDIEPVHSSLHSIRLYNADSPFADQQWALASVAADSMLFMSQSRVVASIVYSACIALLVGMAFIGVVVNYSTKPLMSLVKQIEESHYDQTLVANASDTYEVLMLYSTINAMRSTRRSFEAELREERERYLVALESAADTFMEYDTDQDRFMLYYFTKKDKMLKSKMIYSFIESVNTGEVCHSEDIVKLLRFVGERSDVPVEIRMRYPVFADIDDVEPDEGYHWIQLKASYIYDDDGAIKKVIGVARQITQEKKSENALLEAARLDPTTGLFIRDYGVGKVKHRIRHHDTPYALCMVYVSDLDILEANYGRVFGGVVLMRLSRELKAATGEDGISTRLNNEQFLIFLPNTCKREVDDAFARIFSKLADIYMGENPELRLSLYAGCVISEESADYDDSFRKANTAAQFAMRTRAQCVAHYGDLPVAAQNENAVLWGNPVSVSLNISAEEIVGLTFDLFEHTSDIRSVVNLLLITLGELFSFDQIIICSYDADFSANQVSHQWNAQGVRPYHLNIEKVTRDDIDALEQMLDVNGSLLFKADSVKTAGVRRLLCVLPGEKAVTFGCVMFDRGIHIGRILFKSLKPDRVWTDDEKHRLQEVAKIISAHIIIDKSNSASRAKSEFLSRMSHEIRTPMNAIIGMTRIANECKHDPKRLSDCLEKVDVSARHLLNLINEVLEMSRIESGKLIIESAPFSISGFLSAIDMLMRPQLEGLSNVFLTRLRNRHDTVIGDEYRLRQVLVNLLGNAGKFTENGYITLAIEELETSEAGVGIFKFSVKDTGIGISREDQKAVFKAFEQATVSDPGRRREGTGLGLAISSNIVNAMGGKIELISALGKGSEFSFALKMRLGEERVAAIDPEVSDVDYKAFFEGKRLLVVEDNELNIEITEYALQSEGFVVDVARNGREALEKFFSAGIGYYSAILMDIQMPVMDGLTATRELRKSEIRPDAKTIPIIAMTADAFSEDMKKSIESGMNGHIAKPVDNDRLYALLRQLISKG